MTKDTPDVLTGESLSKADAARYAALAERVEREEYEPAADGAALAGDQAQAAASALLDSIIGSQALDRAIGRGRPGLEGRAGAGASPKRQFRLPRELDDLLMQRAQAEQRRPSEIMRDALDVYLHAS